MAFTSHLNRRRCGLGGRGFKWTTYRTYRVIERKEKNPRSQSRKVKDLNGMRDHLDGRGASLYALHVIAETLMDEDVHKELEIAIMSSADDNQETNSAIDTPPGRLISFTSKGILGALDHTLAGFSRPTNTSSSVISS